MMRRALNPLLRLRTHVGHHSRSYHELSFFRRGEPRDVLEYRATDDEDLNLARSGFASNEEDLAMVKMRYSPWNPADMNTVQGKYPLPHASMKSDTIASSRIFIDHQVTGSEGIGRLLNLSPQGESADGPLVALAYPGQGACRSSLILPKDRIIVIPRSEELLQKEEEAALSCLFQLGGTALRMLSDFHTIQPGDIILQNAGTSGVGLMLSQLATAMFGAKVISIVRKGDRSADSYEEMKHHLLTVGMNEAVVAEEDLATRAAVKEFTTEIKNISGAGTLPVLGLNAVGGKSADIIVQLLASKGTMVTYGGMSMQPVSVGTAQLIFKDVRIRGYWHSRWMVDNPGHRQQMIDALTSAVLDRGVVCPPVKVFPLAQVKDALDFSSIQGQQGIRKKLVFDCKQ